MVAVAAPAQEQEQERACWRLDHRWHYRCQVHGFIVVSESDIHLGGMLAY